ncbi:hypothetical protein, partial [Nonomuraea angiospora]|uniref:hypothetical protein n=1 Tax=Nonomuraea angiospora TaxID=46172 RepID=UPI0029AFE3BC
PRAPHPFDRRGGGPTDAYPGPACVVLSLPDGTMPNSRSITGTGSRGQFGQPVTAAGIWQSLTAQMLREFVLKVI